MAPENTGDPDGTGVLAVVGLGFALVLCCAIPVLVAPACWPPPCAVAGCSWSLPDCSLVLQLRPCAVGGVFGPGTRPPSATHTAPSAFFPRMGRAASASCATVSSNLKSTMSESYDLVVIGTGGYVGLEQAQLFAHLGVAGHPDRPVRPHAEPEAADVLHQVFSDDGIRVIQARATAVRPDGNGVLVRTGHGSEVSAERLLVATGRHADTGDLGLEAAGVKTDDRGFIVVDDHQRTTNPRIFAAGDVSGVPQYVYLAAQTGHAAAAAAGALGDPTTVDYTGLPAVAFTTPQLASAGLTEAEALARGHRRECRVLGAQDIPRALANHDMRGVLKLVVDPDSRKVLGVHAALDGAGDVMLAATYAIKFGLTVEDLADTWAPYLTMAEGLRIAAGLFRSTLPTSCCA